MCDEKDAKRNEKLAKLHEEEGDREKAREHYLEAASIYVLNAELYHKEHLLALANACYWKAEEMRGELCDKNFSMQELAKRTLEELEEVRGKEGSKTDLLTEIRGLL